MENHGFYGRQLAHTNHIGKPGGRLALLFRTNESQAVGAFPANVYRFPPLDDIAVALKGAGFTVEMVDAESERTSPVLGTAAKA